MDSPVTIDTEKLYRLLAAQPFVAGLGRDAYSRVVDSASCHYRGRSQFLFRQGEPATEFFVVATGSLKLYRMSSAGDEKIVARVGPGQSFAEGVLFMEPPRYPVHAQAMEASQVLGLSRQVYRDILVRSPDTCLSVMSELTGRIRRLLDEIESLTLQNGRDRVIHFLLSLMPRGAPDNTTIKLPTRKATVAAQLSIRPETLSRILSGLARDGLLVRTSGPTTFRIPAPDALRRQVPNPEADHEQ